MLTPVAMAFRKESKNEEGSGCNGARMDTVLQAAARMKKNQASLVSRVCKLHRRRLQYNSRAAFTEYLYGKRSPGVLSGGGGGVRLFQALVFGNELFCHLHGDEIHL